MEDGASYPRSKLEEHSFESIFPDRPIDDFVWFQSHYAGKEIEFHEGFGHFKGPVICFYDPDGMHYPALMARIQIDPKTVTERVDGVPKNDFVATDAFVSVWGNIPSDVPGNHDPMVQPQSLMVGRIPNTRKEKGEGIFHVHAVMHCCDGSVVPIDRSKEEKGHETGLPVGNFDNVMVFWCFWFSLKLLLCRTSLIVTTDSERLSMERFR